MSRDGGKTRKKRKTSTLKHPNPDSRTTTKRQNRGWKSLESSSRIHKRAARRQAEKRIIDSKDRKPGEKALCAAGPNPRKQWMHTAGGSMKYY